MAAPFSGQGKQQRKITLRQVLEQLEADNSDFCPELDSDSDSDSDELFQPHESDGCESSAQDSDSSNDSSSDEDMPFAETASPQMEPNRAAKTYSWRKKGFELPDVNFQGEQVESYQDAATDTPLVYFRRVVSLDMLAYQSIQCSKAWEMCRHFSKGDRTSSRNVSQDGISSNVWSTSVLGK